MKSPHNPTYAWLRPYVEALISKKTNRGDDCTASGWDENISSMAFEPFACSNPIVSVQVRERWHGYLHLNYLSLGRLNAISSFMRDREQIHQQRQPLIAVRNRKAWTNHLVIHLHQPYAIANPARIIDHAANRHCQHLGDCWLVQFKREQEWGSRYYVEAAELFSLSLPRWQSEKLEPSQTEYSIERSNK